MKILIVSATPKENGLLDGVDVEKGSLIKISEQSNHEVDAMVTGVGAVPTTFYLTQVVRHYDMVINIGIAGAYSPKYPIGSVVCVKDDCFGDYGIDDRGVFKSIADLKFNKYDEFPFTGDWITNADIDQFDWLELPLVRGVTLSTVSGSDEKIREMKERWNADIETMEGVSVFYVCTLMHVKFICLRSISNLVEPRDRSKWEIEMAVKNLATEVRRILGIIQ